MKQTKAAICEATFRMLSELGYTKIYQEKMSTRNNQISFRFEIEDQTHKSPL